MSIINIKFEDFFSSVFSDVPDSFNGQFHSENEEIVRMKKEIREESVIPSAKEDRRNLKNDGSNVARDYQKAFESYTFKK